MNRNNLESLLIVHTDLIFLFAAKCLSTGMEASVGFLKVTCFKHAFCFCRNTNFSTSAKRINMFANFFKFPTGPFRVFFVRKLKMCIKTGRLKHTLWNMMIHVNLGANENMVLCCVNATQKESGLRFKPRILCCEATFVLKHLLQYPQINVLR